MEYCEMKNCDNKMVARITGRDLEEEKKKPKKTMKQIFDMSKKQNKSKKKNKSKY